MGKHLIKTTGFRFSDPDLLHKLDIIAASHKRRRNQEVEWALTQYVKNYEEIHGEIHLQPLEQIPPQADNEASPQDQQLIASTKGHINIPETQKKTTETSAV